MTFYAGKLILHPEALLRLKVRDAYSIHRLIMDLFPATRTVDEQKKGSVSNGVQWVDRGEHLYGREVLLMSDRKPRDLSFPSDVQFAWKAIPEEFFSFDRYRFSIVVNPVVVRDKKRYPLYSEASISEWFLSRAARRGFEVESLMVDKIKTVSFIKDKRQVLFASAHLSGLLTVTDRQLFMRSVALGIGKGRAFGFGFLQLSPIH